MQSDKKIQEEHYSNIGRKIIIRYWIQSIIQSEFPKRSRARPKLDEKTMRPSFKIIQFDRNSV